MRKIIISDDRSGLSGSEEEIFNISDVLSRTSLPALEKIAKSNHDTKVKIKRILHIQKEAKKALLEADEQQIMKNYFSPDGGIMLTQKDVDEISEKMFFSTSEDEIESMNDEQIETFVKMLLSDFCYIRGNTLNFRNEKYYFLFNSVVLNHEVIGIHTSINDYEILDIDSEKFEKDINTQYHRIDQYLKLFSEYFLGMSVKNIFHQFESFSKELNILLSDQTISKIESAIKNIQLNKNKEFNQKIIDENLNLLGLVKKIKEILSSITKRNQLHNYGNTYHDILNLLQFFTLHSQGILQIKNAFGIDINLFLRNYTYNNVSRGIKKLILGLLDAKINILAFMQNITQLIYNEHLLDIHFQGDLILKQEQVLHIHKLIPEKLENFKSKQEKIKSEFGNHREIAIELDDTIGYFCDILIGDKPESFLYATALSNQVSKEIQDGYIEDPIDMFSPSWRLFREFIDVIEKYSEALDAPKYQKYLNDIQRNQRRLEKGKIPKEITHFEPKTNKNYTDAKHSILKKCIRFHREENNPVVIIKTIQNAYYKVLQEGFQSSDGLHILSVNYGGSILAYYAKHIFQKLQGNGRILANIGNIVYSIYDIKNAHDFLSIVDYPFNEYIKEFGDEETKSFLKQRNHLIILDDNTSSGRTLRDLKKLSEQMDIYGKVHIFACRASNKNELYDASIDEKMMLNYIIHSAIETKKTKVGPRKRGYKEVIGTYIGNTLYKTHFKYLKK